MTYLQPDRAAGSSASYRIGAWHAIRSKYHAPRSRDSMEAPEMRRLCSLAFCFWPPVRLAKVNNRIDTLLTWLDARSLPQLRLLLLLSWSMWPLVLAGDEEQSLPNFSPPHPSQHSRASLIWLVDNPRSRKIIFATSIILLQSSLASKQFARPALSIPASIAYLTY